MKSQKKWNLEKKEKQWNVQQNEISKKIKSKKVSELKNVTSQKKSGSDNVSVT